MKITKKIIAVIAVCLLICSVFAGCSKKDEQTDEITDATMLIAYTEECEPFIYTDSETGELTGFDVELIKETFDSFKGDYKNYQFVKVEPGYVLNEDTCYTDADGNNYSAIIMCGGLRKNVGTNNEDYKWSENIIENKIVTVVKNGGIIKNYNDLDGVNTAVVSDFSAQALDKNANIKGQLASAQEYESANEAFAALDNGTVDAVVIDSIDFAAFEGKDNYTVLNGTLDVIDYGFGFTAANDYSQGFNEAVKEMQSVDYGNGDTLTPLAEKYFKTADACVFNYNTEEK